MAGGGGSTSHVAGDVKAIDLYLRIVKEDKASRAKARQAPARDVTPSAGFTQQTRDQGEF